MLRIPKENKAAMGERIEEVENIPSGYSSVRISIICPAGVELDSASELNQLRALDRFKTVLEVKLFWSNNYSGPWTEMPYFSQYCK